MKISGYMLREAIKRWQLRRDTAAAQFDDAIKKFDDETKDSPVEVMQDFDRAERAIAALQEVQTRYNLAVQVTLGAETISLCQAVKLVGGAGRREKMWRSIATPTKDRYSRDDVRDKNQEIAKQTVSQKEATRLATEAARWAGMVRAGIAVANATEMELEVNGDLLSQ